MANLPLAQYTLRLMGLDYRPDNLQEAALGLCKAVAHQRAELGYRLSTFAVPVIQQHMMNYMDHDRLIPVPHSARHSRRPITRARARGAYVLLLPRLHIPVEHEWPDLERSEKVCTLLGYLNQRQRRVIELRYFHDRSLAEVAKALKVTRERVRQIQMKAERKLQTTAGKLRMEP